jgi:hypothetical protein
MNEQNIIPDGDEDIFIEVNYYPQYNQVEIVANDRTLRYLQNILQVLIESPVSGKHFHFDKAANIIEGNVDDLVLMKK